LRVFCRISPANPFVKAAWIETIGDPRFLGASSNLDRLLGFLRNIVNRISGFSLLEQAIVGCDRCERLRAYCTSVAERKKREFRECEYWGKPVPGFGDPKARLWIVGLAPAAHGANRTGRVFTGDKSGQWLYRALYHFGFSNRELSQSRDDGLRLKNVYISSAIRCAPPDNKPLPQELANCAEFLDQELRLLTEVRLLIALGSVGYSASYNLIARHRGPLARPRPRFAHNALHSLGGFEVLCSYHPSRQNTQTGRLTEAMWFAIFETARRLLDQPKER
jgi:uracil-DNA glycosylase family 4